MAKSFSQIIFNIRSKFFGKPAPRVVVLRLQGVIGPDGPMRHAINMNNFASVIEQAFKVPGLSAVALQINSPGGSPVQAGLITDRIRTLAREKDVPILAFTEDVAASGGYMLALAADEIFVHEVSIIGSIGVVSSGFGFSKIMEKFGVDRRLYTAGSKKAMLDPFSDESEEDVARIAEIQKDVHEFFKRMVRERRGKRLKGARTRLFSGDVFMGAEAVKLGLVDGVGDIRQILRERFGKNVKLKVMGEKKPKLSSLLGLGRSEMNWGGAHETETMADLPKGLLSAVQERLFWSRWGL